MPALPSPAFLPPLREVCTLKRVTSAGRDGSIATRLFRAAWGELAGGADPAMVASGVTGRALAAARLGDLDAASLAELRLSPPESAAILAAAVRELLGAVDPSSADELADAAARLPNRVGPIPAFVEALAGQPRAGVTCPGKPRVMLLPAENHAEHCLAVAVFGAVLAAGFRADPTTVFLAGLAHHLHNAAMPDSGFAGEMLLGMHLEPAMARATARALEELEPGLRARIVEARRILADAETPEGRAFHAADVIDRVLEIESHLTAARLTLDEVLGPMALVHDGPVKPFHDRVLAGIGLT